MICKNCKCELKFCLTDMGFSPYANSYLRQKNLNQIESHKKIMEILKDDLSEKIHALEIKIS